MTQENNRRLGEQQIGSGDQIQRDEPLLLPHGTLITFTGEMGERYDNAQVYDPVLGRMVDILL